MQDEYKLYANSDGEPVSGASELSDEIEDDFSEDEEEEEVSISLSSLDDEDLGEHDDDDAEAGVPAVPAVVELHR